MAKVSVILNCQLNNGKEALQPGATVSMDEAKAARLAEMGLVQLAAPPASKTEPTTKSAGRKAPAKTPAMGEDPTPGDMNGEDTGIPDPDDLMNEPEGQTE